jgi:hypothetical protein
LGLVEVEASDAPRVDTDADGNVRSTLPGKKEMLVTWVPNEMLERMDESDREGYKRVATGFSHGPPKDEDGMSGNRVELIIDFVFVSIPPPKGEKYAFSVPVSSLYSILVYPVSQTSRLH